MAWPTLEKSWDVNLNHQFGGVSKNTDHREAMLHFVTTLTGWANNPWTVALSCDSLTAGAPGPGWTELADVIWNYVGSDHSWIVLERPNSGGQLLLDLANSESSSYHYISVTWKWSPAGLFTGGTTDTMPTATDSQTIVTAAATGKFWNVYHNSKQSYTVHARHSQDGKHDYWFWCWMGRCVNAMIFSTPEDAPSGWTYPNLGGFSTDFVGSGGEMALLSRTYSLQPLRGRSNAGTAFSASMIVPVYDGGTIRSQIPEPSIFDGGDDDRPLARLEVGSTHGDGYGVLGRLPDIWAGASTIDTVAAYPDDGSNTFAQFGDLVIPWDGSMPQAW